MVEAVRVLRVTDPSDAADRATQALEECDEQFDVTREHTADGTLDRVGGADPPYDCVVSDDGIGATDGLALLERVREIEPNVPFVLLAEDGSERLASAAIEAGVSSYLPVGQGTDWDGTLVDRVLAHAESYRERRHTSEVEYALIAEAATDAFWTLDPVAERGSFSNGLSAFGYDPETIDPDFEWFLDRVHPEDRERFQERHEAFLAGDESALDSLADGRGEFSNTFRFRRADGDYAYCEGQGVILFDGGDPVKMIGTLTDVTDREERERELERRNERLDEFAGVVSHDLRNPLQVASGRIELASEECDSEFLDDAEDALDRMGTLIDDLLAIARDGTRVREFETVDLEPLVEACWSAVATPEATLTVESPSPVRADRGRLRQLVENLLANAVEYGGPDVTVTVSTLDVGFYVADDGPGVPEGEREAVFDTGYTSGDEGTGFGLAIAEEIAMAHDWEIRVRESDGGGARFEITGVEFA